MKMSNFNKMLIHQAILADSDNLVQSSIEFSLVKPHLHSILIVPRSKKKDMYCEMICFARSQSPKASI